MPLQPRHAALLLLITLSLVFTPRLSAKTDKYDFGRDKLDLPAWAETYIHAPTPAYAKGFGTLELYHGVLLTVDGSGRATERIRTVERILDPEGRKQASCSVGFDDDEKLRYFNAWTITPAGKTFQARETDFREYGDGSDSNMLFGERAFYVHPPAADIGSVYVCESEELLPPYSSEMIKHLENSNEPIAVEEYELDLPPGMKMVYSVRNFKELKPTEVATNHWLWQLHDTPARDLREVYARAPFEALAARLSVLWGDLAPAPGTDEQWTALGQWVTKLEAGRATPTPEITTKALQLTADAPDFYTKLERISEYVQNSVRYFIVVRGIGGIQAHYAGDIFKKNYGDCKDKTTITIALLEAVGIHGHYMPVDDRRGIVDPQSPSSAGNHMIVAIEVPAEVKDARLEAISTGKDGQRYLIFDPTNEETPIGNLPSYLQGSWGILANAGRSQVIKLPTLKPESNTTEWQGSFTLTADGQLSGSIDSLHSGPAGGDMRQLIKDQDEKERRTYWEHLLAHDLPGVTLDDFRFTKPASLTKPIELHYKFTAPHYAKSSGPMMLVRPRVRGNWVHFYDDKPRTLPFDLSGTESLRAHYEITLPEGYTVDELPAPIDLDTDFGNYHSSCTVKDGKLVYERTVKITKLELPANRAHDYNNFQNTILHDEKASVVLMKK